MSQIYTLLEFVPCGHILARRLNESTLHTLPISTPGCPRCGSQFTAIELILGQAGQQVPKWRDMDNDEDRTPD